MIELINIIKDILLYIFIFFIPGFLTSYALIKPKRISEVIALSISLSLIIVTYIVFVFSFLTDKLIDLALIIASVFIYILFLYLLNLKQFKLNLNEMRSLFNFKFSLRKLLIVLFFISIFLFSFFNYNHGTYEKQWDGCVEKYVYSSLKDTKILFYIFPIIYTPFNLNSSLKDDPWKLSFNQQSIIKNNIGLHYNDEPIMAGIPYAISISLFKERGLRIIYATIRVIICLFIFLILKKIFMRNGLAFLGVLIFLSNYLIISQRQINVNLPSLMIICVIFYLLLNNKNMLLGPLYAILIALKPISLLFLPSILYFIWDRKTIKNSMYEVILLVSKVLLVLIPIIIWKQIVRGDFLTYPGFYLYSPVKHKIFGFIFSIPFLITLPFISPFRSPDFPFPSYILMPLYLIKSFGIILTAILPIGLFYLYKKEKKLTKFFIIFSLPLLTLLCVNGNWEYNKITMLILIYLPIIIIIISGICLIARSRNVFFPIILTFLFALILIMFVYNFNNINYELDQRIPLLHKNFIKNTTMYVFDEREDIENSKRKFLATPNAFPYCNILSKDYIYKRSLEIKNEYGENELLPLTTYFDKFNMCLINESEIFVISENIFIEGNKIFFLPQQRIVEYNNLKDVANMTISELDLVNNQIIKREVISPTGCYYADLEAYINDITVKINLKTKEKLDNISLSARLSDSILIKVPEPHEAIFVEISNDGYEQYFKFIFPVSS